MKANEGFEAHTQIEAASNRTINLDRALGGLGLGLAIVRTIVELHGGEVSVKSEGLGKGTELVVRLPMALGEADLVSPTPRVEPVIPEPRGLRVLLVDDNEDAAELLDAALRAYGYVVRTAHDGKSALAIAAELTFDVALLDIGLPEMNGYELARRLRADPRHAELRLVALTGYGRPADLKKARDAGFDEHVVKPVELARIDALLRSEATRAESRAKNHAG